MNEIIMSWPWFDRAIAGVVLTAIIYSPWAIGRVLERIYAQNERIINLLAQIRDQRER